MSQPNSFVFGIYVPPRETTLQKRMRLEALHSAYDDEWEAWEAELATRQAQQDNQLAANAGARGPLNAFSPIPGMTHLQ